MTPQQQQLIELIAREVIAQLKARQQTASSSPAGQSPHASRDPVDVRPVLGACTGDYSKFPELAERLNPPRQSSASASSTANTSSHPQAPTQAALSGIVTENQLREAIKASAAGVALLAPDARLTPLASDFARQFPQKIKRATDAPASSSGSKSNPAGSSLPWLWWIQGQCPVVKQVVGDRASQLRTMGASNIPESLVAVVRELAQAIKSDQAAGGLLFVPSAARAMCLANRCSSIRAVVGTCGQAVEEGVRDLGANVLIIEYPHHGPRAVSAMVDRLLSQTPTAPPAVQRDLADLHRCG